jgi:hypothetical protein
MTSMAEKSRSKRKEPKPLPSGGEMQATDFAITTVNFPDRLDAREMNDRKIEDDDSHRTFRFDGYLITLWIKRLIVLAVLGGLAYLAVGLVRPLVSAMSPAQVSDRLSKSIGRPVRVAETGFRVTPSPRLVLTGVNVDNALQIDEVALMINWTNSWQAVQRAPWTGGEAVASPTRLNLGQAQMLLAALPGLSTGLPAGISTVHFSSLQFADMPLLPSRYDVTTRRGPDGRFASAEIREMVPDGSMVLKLSPVANGDQIAFQLDAANWKAPVGGNVRWTDISASGNLAAQQIDADYSISAFYGVTRGSISATGGDHWDLTGKASSTNLDVESMVGQAIGRDPAKIEKGDPTLPLGGTATMTATLSGSGATLDEALHGLVVKGPVDVRWGILNGINLGYAATRANPGSLLEGSGGNTRFTDLSAQLEGSGKELIFRDITGKAGAMLARGALRISTDKQLSGALRVDLGETRVQAPLNLRVHGSLAKPQYGG